MVADVLPFAAVILTGLYQTRDGWQVSLDLAISTDATNESKEHRMEMIRQKIVEGDYAKVLQKIRALLKNNKDVRSKLCAAVNSDIGRLRLLTAQLRGPSNTAYLERQLGLGGLYSPDIRTVLGDFSWEELQARARAIVGRLRVDIGRSQPEFLKATAGL